MCCGMNSMGVASSGGAGKALADWVVDGDPGVDLSSVDVRRFARVRDTLMAVRDRAAENLSLHYAIGYPGHEFATARRLRLSPLHERLATLGAEFGDRGGWERRWFQPKAGGVSTDLRFGKPHWFNCVARERAGRSGSCRDFRSDQLWKVTRPGTRCRVFPRRVCAGRLDVPPGALPTRRS